MNISEKVLEFRLKLKLPVSLDPHMLTAEEASFYARFVMEELSEFLKAHEDGNMTEAADAVIDLIYVMLGCAHHMGLPFNTLFGIVHEANMQKEPGATKRGVQSDAIKPEGWVSPEEKIRQVLNTF